jgi:hypothetical protein
MFKIILISFFALLFGCTSGPSKHATELSFDSAPQAVDVFLKDGTKIGTTPFKIQSGELQKYSESGFVLVKARKVGVLDESFLVPLNSYGEFKLKLTQVSNDHFNNWVMPSYSVQMNELTKTMLEIQAKLFLREFKEAKIEIEKLKLKFPHLAAGHTMLATLALHENKREEARGHLIRALEIDKNDSTATRLLNSIDGKKE